MRVLGIYESLGRSLNFFVKAIMIICYLRRLAQEDIEPMVVCVWSAYLLLSCMTGFIWDLWHLYLLLFTGSLLTSSLREKGKGVVEISCLC